MNKILFLLIIFIASCSGEKKSEQYNIIQPDSIEEDSLLSIADSENDESTLNEVSLAKNWLVEAINNHFNQDLPNLKSITTEEYYGYKIDVMNSNFSHGIDLDSIKKKWSYKYDVSSDDIDVGFLIDAQDNGKMEIESCQILNRYSISEFIFSVVLYDTLFKARYKSDVTVIPYNGSYAIDYVKEYFK
jgi:hypothetical protein